MPLLSIVMSQWKTSFECSVYPFSLLCEITCRDVKIPVLFGGGDKSTFSVMNGWSAIKLLKWQSGIAATMAADSYCWIPPSKAVPFFFLRCGCWNRSWPSCNLTRSVMARFRRIPEAALHTVPQRTRGCPFLWQITWPPVSISTEHTDLARSQTNGIKNPVDI